MRRLTKQIFIDDENVRLGGEAFRANIFYTFCNRIESDLCRRGAT